MKTATMAALGLGGVLFLAACGPTAHIKTGDEPEIIGTRKAGLEVFDRLVSLTEELLQDAGAQLAIEGERKKVAFVGIHNMSAEELADNRESMYERINEKVVNSRKFTNIAKEYVDAVLRETGMRPEDLFLQRGYESFVSVLRRNGQAPDYLLYGKVTSGTTEAEDIRQRSYLLTLKLIDAETGSEVVTKLGRVDKVYED